MSGKYCLREICLCSFLTIFFLYGKNVRGGTTDFNVPPGTDPCGARYKEGELIVRFAPKAGNIQATTAERNSILSGLGGGEVKNTFKLVPGLSVVKLPDGVKVEEVLENFNKAEGILYAHPDYVKRAFSIFPNDPNFSQLWGLHNTGQTSGTPDADIDAPEAWDLHTSGEDIVVAVIDTGIDYTHPDLAANMWVNPGEIPGNGIDDDEPIIRKLSLKNTCALQFGYGIIAVKVL